MPIECESQLSQSFGLASYLPVRGGILLSSPYLSPPYAALLPAPLNERTAALEASVKTDATSRLNVDHISCACVLAALDRVQFMAGLADFELLFKM